MNLLSWIVLPMMIQTASIGSNSELYGIIRVTKQFVGNSSIGPDPTFGVARPITGYVAFHQETSTSQTLLEINLQGFLPNKVHGIHIHQKRIENNNCSGTEGHYNPLRTNHGGPNDVIRHHGDLGNITSDATGSVLVNITDRLITMTDKNTIIGKSFVIHAKGDVPTSYDGNAGDSIACGNIVQVSGSWGSNANLLLAFWIFLIHI
ncbi:superoxide dismutase [Globomyces pollinis-pini]|nr:superoxide dismutase [Globomyces pollinis-pini]KAJ3000469.1 Superoxide dismutase [Cu-Zn] [Globomyces sp. JEL0801]